MPGGPLCTIGPLSAISTTSVFSAMPSFFSSLIKVPIRTSSGVISSCGHAAIGGQLLRRGQEGAQRRPVGDIERLLRRRILPDEGQRPLLELALELHDSRHGSARRPNSRTGPPFVPSSANTIAVRTPARIDVVGVLGEHLREQDTPASAPPPVPAGVKSSSAWLYGIHRASSKPCLVAVAGFDVAEMRTCRRRRWRSLPWRARPPS